MSKVGFLEIFNSQMVSGWIATGTKGESIKIVFSGQYIETVLTTALAEVERPDTGIPSYGFYFPFPVEFLSVDDITVSVFYKGIELENSPQKIVFDVPVVEKKQRVDIDVLHRRSFDGVPGGFDFSFPEIDKLMPLLGNEIKRLGEDRFLVATDASNNEFYVAESQSCIYPIRLTFHGGAHNNILIVGRGAEIYGAIDIHGSNNLIIIGEDISDWSMLKIRMWSNNQILLWGKGSTSNGVEVVMQGEGGKVLVADDCMFANNIYIRNSDMHPMVSLETKEWINKPRDVLINRHVWVAQEALILKGVTIGKGAIVGAKSLVNKNVPEYSLVAGVPAMVTRNDVSWDRSEFPRIDVIDSLANDCYRDGGKN